jgi:hypothetical protein
MKPWAIALALGSTLISAGDAMAQIPDKTVPCIIERRFEPGPIVNGHHRQPTLGEVEARTQQLRAFSKAGAGFCLATPRDQRGGLLSVNPKGPCYGSEQVPNAERCG